MFVSLPAFEIAAPTDPIAPDAKYWCGLGVAGDDAWFIVRLMFDVPPDESRLTLLAMDSAELLSAITKFEPCRVESLTCVLPSAERADAEGFVRLTEIWVAGEQGALEGSPVIFRDEMGTCRTGRRADRVRSLEAGMQLKVKVGSAFAPSRA